MENGKKPTCKQRLAARAKQLKTDIPAVWILLKHKDTPWYIKALAAVTLVYALSPIDLIPDFIPVIGLLDDLVILPALIALTLHLLPKDRLQEAREQAAALAADASPKKRWLYALPFLLVWAIVLVFVIKGIVTLATGA